MDIGKYFDSYWHLMNTTISDARSLEKAAIANGLLGAVEGPVLDAGCGRGVVAAFLIERGRKVFGIDASQVAVGAARERGVQAAVLDLEKEGIEGSYAAALCLDILQHSPYPRELLTKVAGAVRDGGVVIISLPNEFHILRRIGVFFGRTRFARYDGPHPRLFWKAEAARLAGEAGLVVKEIVAISLVPPRHRVLRPAGKVLARLFPTLMALGYVLKTEKRPN